MEKISAFSATWGLDPVLLVKEIPENTYTASRAKEKYINQLDFLCVVTYISSLRLTSPMQPMLIPL